MAFSTESAPLQATPAPAKTYASGNTPALQLANAYQDNQTKYYGNQIERVHGVLDSLAQTAFLPWGAGVVPFPDATSLQVSAGTGLQVNVAAGAAIVPVGGGFAPVLLPTPIVLGPVAPNRGASNPLYLHLMWNPGAPNPSTLDPSGAPRGDSFETVRGTFTLSDVNALPNARLLAQIQTSATGVLGVSDGRTFIKATAAFIASGANHSAGLVPDPGATLGTSRYLREDGGFAVPPANTGPQGNPGVNGTNGTNGIAGSNGTNGTNGATMRDGSGVPANTLGVDGDYYLNDATGDIYKRTSGVYAIAANIKGAQGIQGIQGIQGVAGNNGTAGTNGSNGVNGATWRSGSGAPANTFGVDNDLYLNNATGDVYTRSGGIYSITANIKGPQGPAGSGTGGTVQGFNPRGAWAANTTYAAFDIVTYGGSTYEASTSFTSGATFNAATWNLWAAKGNDGAAGVNGTNGSNGVGVPTGGTTGQVLAKNSATNYDTAWINAPTGGGSSAFDFNSVWLYG